MSVIVPKCWFTHLYKEHNPRLGRFLLLRHVSATFSSQICWRGYKYSRPFLWTLISYFVLLTTISVSLKFLSLLQQQCMLLCCVVFKGWLVANSRLDYGQGEWCLVIPVWSVVHDQGTKRNLGNLIGLTEIIYLLLIRCTRRYCTI